MLRLLFMGTESSDNDGHLWIIAARSRRRWGPLLFENGVLEGEYGYRSLGHALVSLFPERFWLPAARLLGVLYDMVSLVALYGLAAHLYRETPTVGLAGLSAPVAAVALAGTCPILLPLTARLRSFGARTLGGALNLLYFIAYGVVVLEGVPALYPLCVLLGVAIVLTSQFGMQNWLFLSLGLAVWYGSPVPLGLVALSLLVGLMVPSSGVRAVLRHTANHYMWYWAHRKGTTAEKRNRLADLVRLPITLLRDPAGFLNVVLHRNSLLIALYSVPMLPVLVLWAVQGRLDATFFTEAPWTAYLAALCVGALAAFVLTSLRPFLFLGQAERYLEYGVFYGSLLFVQVLLAGVADGGVLMTLVFFQVAVVCGILCVALWPRMAQALRPGVPPGTEAVLACLRRLEAPRIVCIHSKLAWRFGLLLRDRDASFYYHGVSRERLDGFAYLATDMDVFGFPRPPLRDLHAKYGIDTVVAYLPDLLEGERMGVTYAFAGWEEVHRDEHYVVYRLGADGLPPVSGEAASMGEKER